MFDEIDRRCMMLFEYLEFLGEPRSWKKPVRRFYLALIPVTFPLLMLYRLLVYILIIVFILLVMPFIFLRGSYDYIKVEWNRED